MLKQSLPMQARVGRLLKVSTLKIDLPTFGDADKDVFSAAVYSMEQYSSGISLSLLYSKSRLSEQ